MIREFALKQHHSLITDIKDDHSPVTNVDIRIASMLVKHISQSYPNHQILSEEGSRQNNNGDILWTIDPIDGTRVYISGLPAWGISAGVFKHGKSHAGCFYMPAIGEMYWGVGDTGYFNGQPISPSKNTDPQDPLAFIAVPSNTHLKFEISFHRLRALGSTAAHLAYVARGVAMAALTRPLYIWDVAAILPLLRAAEVSLVYLTGKPFDPQELLDGSCSKEPLLAAPYEIIEFVRKMINPK